MEGMIKIRGKILGHRRRVFSFDREKNKNFLVTT